MDLSDRKKIVHQEFKALKLSDLRIIATLGVGGFGRVELVQIAGDTKHRSFALKQMKKSQVRCVFMRFFEILCNFCHKCDFLSKIQIKKESSAIFLRF